MMPAFLKEGKKYNCHNRTAINVYVVTGSIPELVKVWFNLANGGRGIENCIAGLPGLQGWELNPLSLDDNALREWNTVRRRVNYITTYLRATRLKKIKQ